MKYVVNVDSDEPPRIHRYSCRHAQARTKIRKNGFWSGCFDSYQKAHEYAMTRVKTRRPKNCQKCKPQEPDYLSDEGNQGGSAINNYPATTSQVFFNDPYEVAWTRLTDPYQFPKLYPHWKRRIAKIEVEMTEEEGLRVVILDPDVNRYHLIPYFDHNCGVIDFDIIDKSGNSKHFRSRLIDLYQSGCVLAYAVF